jgi:hypothetical protein
MKNYLSLLEDLNNRKIIQAKIVPYLVVDKEEYAQNIDKIKDGAKNKKLKA